MKAYSELKQRLNEIADIANAEAFLGWDMEVMMPPGGAADRGRVLATLSAIRHDRHIDPKIGELIAAAEKEVDTPEDRRNLFLIKQEYQLATAVPSSLIAAIETARNHATTIWMTARPANDWQAVQQPLQDLFTLICEQADIHAAILGCDRFDAQLAQCARGNRQSNIDPLFAQLKQALPPLLQAITTKQQDHVLRQPTLPVAVQEKITRELAEQIGFDFTRGRLDIAAHPFSGGSHNDSRITTRYSEENLSSSLFSTIHETGHALYSQNLPDAWDGQPAGAASDMSLHESQSLIMEKQAGLTTGFLHYLHGLISRHANDFPVTCPRDEFVSTMRHVAPGFIRIEADEVSYPLHIILRYEIEKKLFAGEITMADVPMLWNTLFHELFGLAVPEDRLGCLQDIHWCWALFGYFPTYTQGALYAAQLFAAIKKALPGIEKDFERGDMTAMNLWLKDHIHQHGQLYDAPDLIERATGHKPDARYFLDHLKSRYL